MNIVIIKHFGDNAHYMFSVPDDKQLREKDIVLVRNKRGEQAGVCVCDSFFVDESPLKALIARYGAKQPLSPVIGMFGLIKWDCDNEQ